MDQNQNMTTEGGAEVTMSKGERMKKMLGKVQEYKRGVGIFALLVIITGALFYYKGLFVAASVDGALISRFSVIGELEKQSGKQALDTIIVETLIKREAAARDISVSEDEITEEIKNIETRVASQGGTLSEALAMQGMTEDALRAQIRTQKQIEKMLADKIVVSDEEVQKYITENKIAPPKDKEQEARESIKEQLKNDKLNKEVRAFITSLKEKAKIKYYVNY